MGSLKTNLAILIIFTTISAYASEVILYLIEPAPWQHNINERRRAAIDLGINFDERTKWEVVNELRNEGKEAYPIFFPHRLLPDGLTSSNNQVFPLSSISHKLTVLCNESGEWISYFSDRYGFNNPDYVWSEKNPDIVLVGDSFTQGICVEPEDNMAGQLRRSGYKVINLGMGGNGPLLDLASIKEYAKYLKPKIVIWLYYEDNDLVDFSREEKSVMVMNYLHENYSQNLIGRQREIDSLLQDFINNQFELYGPDSTLLNILTLKHISYKTTLLVRSLKQNKAQEFPQPGPLFKSVLLKARDIVASWNGKLYFVYLPKWSRYAPERHIPLHNYYRDDVLSIINDLNIPVIDTHENVFMKHSDPPSLFPLRIYGHYNAKGYRYISEVIVSRLESAH